MFVLDENTFWNGRTSFYLLDFKHYNFFYTNKKADNRKEERNIREITVLTIGPVILVSKLKRLELGQSQKLYCKYAQGSPSITKRNQLHMK